MIFLRIKCIACICLIFLLAVNFVSAAEDGKKKIVIVDSYHHEYLWSQQTSKGFLDALLKFYYVDNEQQVDDFLKNNFLESSKVVIKRLWMDTKRQKDKEYLAKITSEFTKVIREFKSDIILLGDDNAANYIGNQFLDTPIPIVFWGVNNTPVKYGLVDSEEKPGHNVTGVYQTTYYKESLQLLKNIVPQAKTFAILSDDTTTGRIHTKALQFLARKDKLPLKLTASVTTNDLETWKNRALELQNEVDSFFIASSNGLKDLSGRVVSNEEAAEWYVNNIMKPSASGFRYRVEAGWLCAADDSGYNQGFEGGVIAHDLLSGADPSTYPPRIPPRGPLMVNKKRARMLGITLTDQMGIEEYIEENRASKEEQNGKKEGGK